MEGVNDVYAARSGRFDLADYPAATQALLREKLKPVDEIIASFPRRCTLYSTFAMGVARGLLRRLGERRDFEALELYSAMTIEPYSFLQQPQVTMVSAYASPLDRFLASKMGKSVVHLPRQFVQFTDVLREPGRIDVHVHSCTPPDSEGFVNLGVNCEILYEVFKNYRQRDDIRLVLEINPWMPWVMGVEAYDYNRLHLSEASAAYVHVEAMPQIPCIVPSEVERRIAGHVQAFVGDGDTLQLGIGGVPTYVAQHLCERRGLKVHSEMLTDGILALHEAGALDSADKALWDGMIVGSFAAGTDRLYDWVDRNPEVRLLPIQATNDPCEIGRNRRMKSINSALLVDLHGQVCSDAVGFKQVSGIGGQLEFVMGAQRSEGGRSVLCLKSTRKVKGRRVSSICSVLPPGTPVSVPRCFADVIVTEYGAAEIKDLDAVDRAHALVAIAHPEFRAELQREAEMAGLWQRAAGFDRFDQRLLYNHLGTVLQLKRAVACDPKSARRIILREARALLRAPDLTGRLKRTVAQSWPRVPPRP